MRVERRRCLLTARQPTTSISTKGDHREETHARRRRCSVREQCSAGCQFRLRSASDREEAVWRCKEHLCHEVREGRDGYGDEDLRRSSDGKEAFGGRQDQLHQEVRKRRDRSCEVVEFGRERPADFGPLRSFEQAHSGHPKCSKRPFGGPRLRPLASISSLWTSERGREPTSPPRCTDLAPRPILP
jgi:hypothetical protein